MSMHNHVICLSGDSHDIQTEVANKIDDGYKIIEIHSQYVDVKVSGYNDKTYSTPKSIVWLQKEVEVTHG